jgi:colanic acid biosynthesis glycosyl transferase WcaI
VVRVPLYPEHSRSGLRRAINYVSFALSATLMGLLSVPRPDVMFVYHPPLTVGIAGFCPEQAVASALCLPDPGHVA